MATKKKSTLQRIVDTIGNFVRQPMSDESNETPSAKAVRQAKGVAAGPKKRKAKPAAKQRTTVKKGKKNKPRTKKR